jgi:hypothetical protein
MTAILDTLGMFASELDATSQQDTRAVVVAGRDQ